MPISHVVTLKVVGSGVSISKDVALTGGSAIIVDESIPDSSTDLEVLFELDVSTVQSIFITSDSAVTLETNSGSTPDDTIVLVANQPVLWYVGSSLVNPLTVDITTNIFVTNASGSAARLQIIALYDPTP